MFLVGKILKVVDNQKKFSYLNIYKEKFVMI